MSTLLIIVVLILIFGGGGGYFGNRQWGPNGGLGGALGVILLIFVVLWLVGGISEGPYFARCIGVRC